MPDSKTDSTSSTNESKMAPQDKKMGGRNYTLESVDQIDPPEGSDDKNWHSYVIQNGHSTINGARRGTRKQVTEYATEYASELNERRGYKSISTWSTQQSKKVKTPA
jgi:hypothetical protein